jgi:hypothetical protein
MQNLPFAAQQDQVNKFLQANRVLGAQMDQMQGTTRIIYDTQNCNSLGSYDFFSQVSSKANTLINNAPASNISQNRFEPGEGMVIKECGILLFNPALGPGNRHIDLSLLNITVGNNKVVKDLPISTGSPLVQINPINYKNQFIGDDNTFLWNIRFLTNIVIPPQIQFFVNLKFPTNLPNGFENQPLIFRLYLKGYGKLFNPRNNY